MENSPSLPSRKPVVSVLIPEAFDDPRGSTEYIKSWTTDQVPADTPFEVVVAMKEGNEVAAAEARRLLRPDDQLVLGDFDDSLSCYVAGVEAAGGDYLLITENHTVADPDCLSEVVRYLCQGHHRAASLRSGFLNRTHMDQLEQGLYLKYLGEKWLQEKEWNRVRLRGFVIEKSLYLELGGLLREYGLFSEEYLASKLARNSIEVGYIDDAIVAHVNTEKFSQLRNDIEDFAFGECVFRDGEYDRSYRPYFGEPAEWRNRAIYLPGMRRRLARSCVGVCWDLLRRGQHELAMYSLGMAAGQYLKSLLGNRALVLWSEACLQWHRFGSFLFQDSDSGLRAFEKMWQAVRFNVHKRYYIGHSEPGGYRLPATLEFEEADPPQLLGFYEGETHEGRSFRWTGPLAAVRLRLETQSCQVTIDTNGLRGEKCAFPFAVVFDERFLPPLTIEEGRISFPLEAEWIDPAGEQLLVVVSLPFGQNQEESRALGIPVFDINIEKTVEPDDRKTEVAVPECKQT